MPAASTDRLGRSLRPTVYLNCTRLDALAHALPGAARIALPGQSHFATHTGPERFAEAVRRFCLRLEIS